MKNLFIKIIRSILNVLGIDIIKNRRTFNQTYKDNIGKKPIIFDVGANVGKWSKLALDNLGHPILLHL